MKIAHIEGTYVVRTFSAGLLGRSFAFAVTKSVRKKALRASAEPANGGSGVCGAGF